MNYKELQKAAIESQDCEYMWAEVIDGSSVLLVVWLDFFLRR